jgi:hypothetical protein
MLVFHDSSYLKYDAKYDANINANVTFEQNQNVNKKHTKCNVQVPFFIKPKPKVLKKVGGPCTNQHNTLVN